MVYQYNRKDYKLMPNCTNHCQFEITPADTFQPTIDNLNLSSDINLTNVVLFNDGRIKKYDTLHEIFVEFCRKRYDLYERRKNKMIQALESSLRQEKVKHRFIVDVMEDRLVVFKKSEAQVEEQLKKLKYPQEFYPMLFTIQVRSFTNDHVSALENTIKELEKKLKELKATTIETMWKKELDLLVNQLEK
jgi:hypothetical protein